MSSGPPSGSSFGQAGGLTNDDMLYYVDMSLIGVLGLVTLIYLPRTIARYTHTSAFREGWALLRGNPHYPQARVKQIAKDKEPTTSNASRTQYPPAGRSVSVDTFLPPSSTVTHINRTPTIKAHLLNSENRGSGKQPAHVPGYRSYVPILGRILDYHILGHRFGQLIVLAAYLAVICVALFYKSSPVTNVSRAGFVVMSQMPIVFALGTKNSVITALTGISYEQLNFVHRWVGQLMFIAALFHFVGWLVMWTKLGVVAQAVKGNVWGLVAFFALCFLALGSHPWIRAKLYTLFWHTHIVGLLAMMIGVWKHQPTVAAPYVATCIALYGADQLARVAKSRLRKAILTPVPELGCTHVYIPHVDKGWIAGQHVRLRVLSFGVGLFGWTEAHPFTIANASNDASGGLSLVCKRAGDWTSGLYRMASDKSKEGDHRSVYVLVEGPYGGPGNTVIPSFSGVMLVLGGSGITFGTSILEDIVAKSLNGTARTLCVNFVWVVQHPSAADPYLSSFAEIVQRAAALPNLNLTLSVFYTRGADKAFALRTRLPPNIQIRSGRPDLGKELEEVLRVTRMSISSTRASKSGVILAGCGPEGLISNIYTAKAEASTKAQGDVGGLELHTETFGW
ncbi:Ferric reductase like transmembrane component [Ceratobasidium sp. AG-Ba]|nr:Ferric reductase like transmembrane component [Ceratobasidium sp. AG-Ba]